VRVWSCVVCVCVRNTKLINKFKYVCTCAHTVTSRYAYVCVGAGGGACDKFCIAYYTTVCIQMYYRLFCLSMLACAAILFYLLLVPTLINIQYYTRHSITS
jgi:hypothetical protein